MRNATVKRNASRRRLAMLAAVGAVSAMAVPTLADRVWDGEAGTPFWTEPTNWNPDGVPTSADKVTFIDNLDNTIDLAGSTQPASGALQGLSFLNTSNNYTIQNGSLSFLTLSQNSPGATNTISAQVNSTGAWNVTGGTLVLSNTNNAISGPIAIASGAKLDVLAPSSQSIGAVTLNGGTLVVRGGATTATGLQGRLYVDTQVDPRNNAGGVNTLLGNAATNTAVLTSATGPNGGLDFRSDTDFENFFNQPLVGSNGNHNYTVAFVGTFNATVSGDHTFGFAQNDDNSAIYVDLNHNGVFEANEQVVQRGCCNQNPPNTNFTGGTATLTAGQSYAIAILNEETGGGSDLGAKFQEPAGGTTTALTVIAPDASSQPQFTFTSFTDANLSGSAIAVTAADSVIDVQSSVGTLGNITFNADTSLTVQGLFGVQVTTGNLSGTGAVTLNTSVPTTVGTLSGFSTFTKGGTSTLTLATDSAGFDGNIVVDAGTLLAASGSSLGSTVGNTTVSSGAQLSIRSDGISEPIVINGTGTTGNGALESGADGNSHTLGGSVTLGSDSFIVSSTGGKTLTLTGGIATAGFEAHIGGNGDTTVSSVGITGAGGIRKTEGGTLNIGAASNYTGVTQVNAGTLAFTAPLSGTSAVNLTAGTINAGAAVNSAATVNVTGGTYNANSAGALDATNNVSSGGVIRVTSGIGTTGAINVNAGGRLQFDAANTSLTTSTNNINVTGLGTVHARTGFADLSTQNIVVSPLTITTINNALEARLIVGQTGTGLTADTLPSLNVTPTITKNLQQPLNFSNDGEFGTFFGNTDISGPNGGTNFTAIFHGNFTTTTAGSYTLGLLHTDDTAVYWIDRNQNGVFERNGSAGDELITTRGCCGDSSAGVTLAAGQTYGIVVAVEDTGGGSGLGGNYLDPGAGTALVIDPSTQPGRFSFQQSNGGGGTVQVDAGATLSARTMTGVTNTNLSGTLTLAAGTPTTPLSSSTDTLATTGTSPTLNVGAQHTFTAGTLTVAPLTTFTKTGSGTVAVSGTTGVTLNGSTVVTNAGTMDLSKSVLTAIPRVLTPGLYETQLSGSFNEAAFDHSATVVNGTPRAQLVNDHTAFPDNTTFAYTGSINIPAGGAQVAFGENFDDNVLVKIDGVQLDRDTTYNNPTSTGLVTLSAGLHTVEFRFGQGGGGVGPVEDDVRHWGPGTGNNGLGFGIFYNTTGSATDPGIDGSNYINPDPTVSTSLPSNLFVVTTGGGTLQVDPGATLIVGGTSGPMDATLNGTLSYSAQSTPATSTLGSITVASSQTGTIDVQSNQTVTLGSTGSLTLTGNLVKTGAGRLAVNAVGTGTGSISVQGGTLGGVGSIAGPVSVANGGTVAPGNSVGTLTTGDFSVASAGGTLGIELDPTNSQGNGTADNLNVIGTVTLAGGNLGLTLLSPVTVGQTFQILTNDGTDPITGLFTTVNGSPIAGNSFTVPGGAFTINYLGGTGNDVVLTATDVPEPASMGLLALGAAGLLARWRRRRQM